ncbi:GntR family transcriptional regulator [Muricoccus radiodurans]|uniref:GntR family transcriptional regulator n=1 Tax=Muricoccus radiodurans TaxID=2231721 RepID=UPI003CF89D6F
MSSETSSLVDGVVARLEEEIITGRLAMGARLGEQALADRLGVSRGPLREALRRLEGRRLIVRKHNVGAQVAEITTEALMEMLVLREALEGMAARLAARAMADQEINELEQLVAVQVEKERRSEYSPEYQSPNLDFHLHIVRGSRNRQLHEMLYGDPLSFLRVFRYRGSALVLRTPQALAEHRAIVAAIAARDPDTAETAMRSHLRNAHANILANVPR